VIFRQAGIQDIERKDFRELVLRGLQAEKIGMTPSWPKLESLALLAIEEGFWACAEHDDKVVAHIMALVGDNPMFYGRQAQVIAWYSEHPGAGFSLLNRFADWAAEQHVVSVSINTNLDERLSEFLKQAGWLMCPSYLKVVRTLDS